jgi:tripartite-type tricarboxylate transporter receptor subunit TctC
MKRTLAFIALSLAAGCAFAADYPVKTIRIISPFPPGGSVDLVARLLGAELGKVLGQQIVVDNRSGATGMIGTEMAKNAPPDGYTLLINTLPFVTNQFAYAKTPYDPVGDFAPVSHLVSIPMVFAVTPALPAKSVKELIALAKTKPGQITFASAGSGAGGHLSGELFKLLAGIDLLHIPYKGMAPAMVDVISGQVSLSFPSIATALPQIKSGKVRALAVTGAKRSQAASDVITMQEAGVPGYESATWYGAVAPIATPRTLIARLNGEIVTI